MLMMLDQVVKGGKGEKGERLIRRGAQRVNMSVADVWARSKPLLAAGPDAPVMDSIPKSLPSLSDPRPILLVGQGESPPPGLDPCVPKEESASCSCSSWHADMDESVSLAEGKAKDLSSPPV